MKEYKVSEGFIKEAYEAAGAAYDGWKERIKKEFPEVFEVKKLEVGKWYYFKEEGFEFIFQRVKEGSIKVFGKFKDEWIDKGESNWYWADDNRVRLATPEEVKAMLLKEAEKRGYKEGMKLKLASGNGFTFHGFGNFYIRHNTLYDSSGYGLIFENGKWAEIINENNEILERIESLQKELEELKERVK